MPQKTTHRFKHGVPLTQDDLKRLTETGTVTVSSRAVTYVLNVVNVPQDHVERTVDVDEENRRVTITLGVDIAERLISGRRTSLVWNSGEYAYSVEPLVLAEEVHDVSFILDRSGTNVETFTVFE